MKSRAMLITILLVLIYFHGGTGAFAATTPLQIGLAGPVQIFSKNWDIYGLRLTVFHAENYNVYGFDFGAIASKTTHNGGGLQVTGLYNYTGDFIGLKFSGLISVYGDSCYGLSVSGLCNADGMFIHGNSYFGGIQMAGIFNSVTHVTGLQVAGLWNRVHGNITGIQIAGLCNINNAEIFSDSAIPSYTGLTGFQLAALYNGSDVVQGVQIGLINRARRIRGVQIGLINIAGRMSGIQIGLVNIIEEGAIPFLPLFNVSMTF